MEQNLYVGSKQIQIEDKIKKIFQLFFCNTQQIHFLNRRHLVLT